MNTRRALHLSALAVVAALSAAVPAGAGMMTVVDSGVPVGDGLVRYTVRFVADTPDDAAGAVEAHFEGPMHQEWPFGAVITATMEYMYLLTPEEQARDSHLLLFSSDMNQVWAPSEDRDPGTGLGSWLGNAVHTDFAIGIARDSRSMDLAFAQIVVPAGQTVRLIGVVADAIGQHQTALNVTIPEPATLTLLLAAAAALIHRRRGRTTPAQTK